MNTNMNQLDDDHLSSISGFAAWRSDRADQLGSVVWSGYDLDNNRLCTLLLMSSYPRGRTPSMTSGVLCRGA